MNNLNNSLINRNRIKVAYILTPITFGGAEKVSLNFLKKVDRTRFDVKLILLLRPWEKPPYFVQELNKLGYEYIALPVSMKKDGDPLRVLRVAWRIFQLLRADRFDLVHVHGYFADICAIPIARLLGIKTITTCHGFISNTQKLKIYNKLDIYAIKASHKVIAVSDGIKERLIETGVKENKISVITNAVDTEFEPVEIARLRDCKRSALGIGDKEYVVGFLGRLSPEKGVNFLLEAVAQLIKSDEPIRLLIVGEGEERARLEVQATNLEIDDKVIFAGFQTDAHTWLPAFDLFALPSLTEGTPMALLETMAMGLTVIASSVGGVPKVITDYVDGLLVPAASSVAIAEKIRFLIANPDIHKKVGIEARCVVVEKYGLDSWYRAMEQLYNDVIDIAC